MSIIDMFRTLNEAANGALDHIDAIAFVDELRSDVKDEGNENPAEADAPTSEGQNA